MFELLRRRGKRTEHVRASWSTDLALTAVATTIAARLALPKANGIAIDDAVMGALGLVNSASPEAPLLSYRREEQGFAVRAPRNGEPATSANGGTIGLRPGGPGQVDAFDRAGLANGGSDDGPPGVRPTSFGRPYIAYLRERDGTKICATRKSSWAS